MSDMKTIHVQLKNNSHFISIGKNVIEETNRWILPEEYSSTIIIADQKLKNHHHKLNKALKKMGFNPKTIWVSANEKIKDFKKLYPLYGKLLALNADRKSVIFALGGGAVGDAAGFLAATFLRGIHWVNVPTTLLAQVDSSIGGKTGVNHEKGKNLIGAFYQPKLILCETSFLSTLPKRELISGLGEVIKYGLIFDSRFFNWIAKNWEKLLKLDNKKLTYAVHHCAQLKVKVIEKDEHDLKGLREKLNFGHTFAHALESLYGYGKLRHGEAVIFGMRFATAISLQKKLLSKRQYNRINNFLGTITLPKLTLNTKFNKIIKLIRLDKKTIRGKTRFVLLTKVGTSSTGNFCTQKELSTAFDLITE